MICKIGQLCCGCASCENICPKNCISMRINDEGFYYPSVDRDQCIGCNLCEKVCPILNPMPVNTNNKGFVVRALNKEILNHSASGGFFSPIAKYFLDHGGLICAAGFDKNWDVIHILSQDVSDISNMRSSKYVQSNLSSCFIAIKQALKDGKKILFCGTPCQVQSIKKYIEFYKLNDNLYTIDLVCKGVGSPGVWRKYLEYQEKLYNSIINYINFREKVHGYHSSNMVVRFANGKKSSKSKTDLFIKAYITELLSRESCYCCQFKGVDRCSDFTIFDSWNMQQLVEQKTDDDLGYTCVITHNEKAEKLLTELNEYYITYQIDLDRAISLDGIMVNSFPNANKRRNMYLKHVFDEGIESASKKYNVVTGKDRCVELLKSILYSMGLLKAAKRLRRK